ncbi:unnamed protein product [Arabidopsis lyrata]|nr:unnamed protein product [Arabidopsis lyrata]
MYISVIFLKWLRMIMSLWNFDEHSLAVGIPATATVQVTKNKKESNIHLDSPLSAKHGENGSTMAGHVGKQLAYVVRGETKFKNLRNNKTTVGGSVTFLGENIATGLGFMSISLSRSCVFSRC